MRRLIDASKRAAKRVNARIAGFIVVGLIGAVAAWQGVSYTRGTPKAPTKQIEIGPAHSDAARLVQPAVASLSDEQLPSSGGNYRLMQYAQVSDSPSTPQPTQTNPYLPTTTDPAGGYSPGATTSSSSAREIAPRTPYVESPPPATVPSDPTATSQPPATLAPSGSAYRADASPATESPPATNPVAADLTPPPSASGHSGHYGGNHGVFEPPVSPAPSTLPAIGQIPAPNALPIVESNAPKQLNPYRTNSLPPTHALAPSIPSRSEGKLAAPTPGERSFEGPQQPSIALEKVSASEIQVGKLATFALYVRNSGQAPAQNVVVTDHVPTGTQLVDAKPQPQQGGDGSLIWNLGTMQPGEEAQITLQVMPQAEGELGSTAHVSFGAAATSRSISTRPQLAVEHTAPPKVLIGEALTVGITVSNPGTGPATGVIIEEDVPAGLTHVAGSQLEYEVGVLRPGEAKHLELSLRADRAGVVQNRIQVRGEGSLAAQHAVQIEVVAPQLQLAVEGPKRRFLERQATYTLQVANPGTAAARDVELAAFLPRGMRFVSTDSQGQYDSSQHAVFWSLAELQPGQAGAVKLALTPFEPGEQKIQVEGRAALGLTAKGEQMVHVEQAAELVHTVKDLDEVIEVGSETTYEIRVSNSGTKAATNVRVAAVMPPGMAAVNGEGPTRAAGDATQITFAPLERLNPREEVIYKVLAQSRQAGDQIVRVQLSADDLPTVTREESTRVYQDR
jgi:uncharacterized repeat protein (TIGR01451 family)